MDIPCGNPRCWIGRAYPVSDRQVWRCVCGWEIAARAYYREAYAEVTQARKAAWSPTVPHPLIEQDRAAVRDWGDYD